jgi:hypothetical protein
MDACNNGHFWMFHCNEVEKKDRLNEKGSTLVWSQIPRAELDAYLPLFTAHILR